MEKTELDRFILGALIPRGLFIDTSGEGFTHKHNEADPTVERPPIKLHLCTNLIRPEGRMTKDDINQMGWLLYERMKEKKLPLCAITGAPNAGKEIALALQYQARYIDGCFLPFVPLTKIVGEDGISQVGPVEKNDYPVGNEVVPFDDVIHRGTTKIATIRRLQDFGYVVKRFVVFLDYEQGGAEALYEETNVELISVVGLQYVLALGRVNNLIKPYPHMITTKYLKNNRLRTAS